MASFCTNITKTNWLTGCCILGILVNFATPGLAAKPEDLQQLNRTGNCPNCDLSYANLNGRNFKGADLQGANLNAATLRGANLTGANLTGATLTNADLRGARFSRANLTNASLAWARVERVRFDQANLTGAMLGGSKLAGALDLTGATLPNTKPAFFVLPTRSSR
ncbi:pentapeptide repeat-containing protein [Thermosynechococcaceae cyanobacterium BACA0444]|uniref:Pentapeptide repeat-containing protein n=1 Tax=Pseudocalidococcus azoricus BACA0444 TaxID=2918990 RepID=A0AAE4FV73_9CYAN|nr:pentapeptide repeat-containing protein [Pseudocalidococcus azoricus]MDS3861887.1 pentapeptide repeat-containing protein [Pseudocalidococcus azoricus BACA0444]